MSKILLSLPDTLLTKLNDYCGKYDYERSELIRSLIRNKVDPEPTLIEKSTMSPRNEPIQYSTSLPENKPRETGTIPVENTPIGTSPSKIEPEALWEDYNLMPVYKTGEDDQFCTTWHQKGLRQRVYFIKKFRADGTLEFEGKYCKECIKEFLAKDGHLE